FHWISFRRVTITILASPHDLVVRIQNNDQGVTPIDLLPCQFSWDGATAATSGFAFPSERQSGYLANRHVRRDQLRHPLAPSPRPDHVRIGRTPSHES
ncbi:hypothetical protein J6337_31035, partial [Burkholderia pseudomallei]|uniref:hypothetical protein n=1 Tax=Burkholderia pseudomallei TaxID=28450 RepID=UPI001AD65D52